MILYQSRLKTVKLLKLKNICLCLDISLRTSFILKTKILNLIFDILIYISYGHYNSHLSLHLPLQVFIFMWSHINSLNLASTWYDNMEILYRHSLTWTINTKYDLPVTGSFLGTSLGMLTWSWTSDKNYIWLWLIAPTLHALRSLHSPLSTVSSASSQRSAMSYTESASTSPGSRYPSTVPPPSTSCFSFLSFPFRCLLPSLKKGILK